MGVGVTDAGSDNLDDNLVGSRVVQLDISKLERTILALDNGSASSHGSLLLNACGGYLMSPSCVLYVSLSQNRNSSSIVPSLFQ
jgi:hypothetical protein